MPQNSELIHSYKGVPFPTRVSIDQLSALDDFEAREDDVLLVSYPKSGTHWLVEILKNLYCCTAGQMTLTPPLEFQDPSKLCELRNLPSPRVIPTHLPQNMVPRQVHSKNCKVIYVIRNPKDTAVSMFHYYKQNPHLPTVQKWGTFLDLFLNGEVVYGSWIDHLLSWERAETNGNTLFVYYESLKKDLPKYVQEISSFLGLRVSEEQAREIAKRSSFREMKERVEREKEREKPEATHTVCALTSDRKLIFRKGAVGDWKNHFTTEQNSKFEALLGDRINSSELASNVEYEC
ncbi:sulfotransferase 6B1-like [Anguilla rostrata]|uniref:sulfotransferase 6B1-like n=1 Tax=Anguilla anguilla TaxID=7936 RepID=UPI0015ABD0CE|nr:sulfotransferase 6B1-like [Anguilla anguilla]